MIVNGTARRLDRLLARDLVAVVPERDAVDADDRHEQQVRGGSAGRCARHRIQQPSRLPDVLRARRGQMHDGVDALERGGEPVAGGEVGDDMAVAGSAAQDAEVERAGTERLGDVAAEPPGAAGQEDGHVSYDRAAPSDVTASPDSAR